MTFFNLGINCRRIIARIRRLQNWLISCRLRKSVGAPRYHRENFDWNLIDTEFSAEKFIYRDEKWNEVMLMGTLGIAEWLGQPCIPVEDNSPLNDRVIFTDGRLSVNSSEKDPLRWIILKYHKYLGDVFAFEFTAKIESVFSEFQFAFNWQTIATRDRFMICDNRRLVFENVIKGAFISALTEKENPLKVGELVRFRIQVTKSTYAIFINDEAILNFDSPKTPAVNFANFAFIFFEKTADRVIDAQLSELKIFEGVEKR